MLALIALAGAAACAPRSAEESGFLDRSVEVQGRRYAYQVYVPRAGRGRGLPIVLALHGSGERGSDGLLQTEGGLASSVRRRPDLYPALIVFPQAPLGGSWEGRSSRAALAAFEASAREFSADRSRSYLIGWSMGGAGAWELAAQDPARFAAVAVVAGYLPGEPVSGGGGAEAYSALARRLARTPVWIAHGAADPVVPAAGSRSMAAALQVAGGRFVHQELPGVGHDSWGGVFEDPRFAAWLFNQRKEGSNPSLSR